jgi:hypothetical protein
MDRACEDIERAQEHLVQVYAEFQPVHPEYAQYLDAMGKGLGEVATAVARFRDEVI